MSAKRVLSWSIPLLITLLLFLLFLRSTPPREILSGLLSLPWNCLLLYLSLSLGGGFLRAIRFRWLLKRPLPFFRLFLITLVQNCTADLLPVQGLAGFGTWETAFHLVFSLLAPEHPNPFITGLLIHTVTQLWEYLLGLLSFGILLWPSRHPSSPSP